MMNLINTKKSEKGFTLIELMIVVAIIGILAAIAIPQFASYRIKAFNSAANSDLRNAKLGEEALFTDFRFYGDSVANLPIGNCAGAGAAGAVIDGGAALNPGSVNCLAVTAANNGGNNGAATPVAVSNSVQLRADTLANQSSAVLVAEHRQGNRAFGTDTDSTAVYWVQNDAWIGGAAGAINCTVPGVTDLADDFNRVPAGGGAPTATWAPL